MNTIKTNLLFPRSQTHTAEGISDALNKAGLDGVHGRLGMRKEGALVVFGGHTFLAHRNQTRRAKKFMQQHGLAPSSFGPSIKLSTVLANARQIGQSIRPDIAEKYVDTVEFDGIGRIQGFKKHLSAAARTELQDAVMKPLTQTNAAHERDSARTGRDCMIQFMHLMQNRQGEATHGLLDKAKALWLSAPLDDHTISGFLADAAGALADMPHLQSMAITLHNAVSKEKAPTQKNDNMYGRKFDSEFVHELVKNPPAPVMEATRKIGQALLDSIDQEFVIKPDSAEHNKNYTILLRTRACRNVAKNMNVRPWINEAPDLKKFLDAPTYEGLKAMLLNVNHGFDVLKLHYLAAAISRLGYESMPWMQDARPNYVRVIQPANGTSPPVVADTMKTSGYGIRLANHPNYEKYSTFTSAKNSTYHRLLTNMNELGKPEQQALSHGHPVVTGVSGCTNMMTYLSLHIAQKEQSFSPQQAILGTMMYLVFDGGHSLNEIMTVHTSIRSSERTKASAERLAKIRMEQIAQMEEDDLEDDSIEPLAQFLPRTREEANRSAKEEKRKHHLETYQFDYRQIVELAKHGGSDKEVSTAMDTALGKTIEYFKDNSHYAAQNEALTAQHSAQDVASSSSAAHGEIELAPESSPVEKARTTLTELLRMEAEEGERERARDKP